MREREQKGTTPIKDGMPPIHPSEFIAEDLAELGLSAGELDGLLGAAPGTVAAILDARRGVDADFALRWGRYLGTGPQLWLNLQVSYDLKMAEQQSGCQIQKQVQPRPGIPASPEAAD